MDPRHHSAGAAHDHPCYDVMRADAASLQATAATARETADAARARAKTAAAEAEAAAEAAEAGRQPRQQALEDARRKAEAALEVGKLREQEEAKARSALLEARVQASLAQEMAVVDALVSSLATRLVLPLQCVRLLQ